jgi:hypothetical protein
MVGSRDASLGRIISMWYMVLDADADADALNQLPTINCFAQSAAACKQFSRHTRCGVCVL